MQTKFTPGPWHVDTNEAGDYTQIKAHPNKFICEVDGREKEYMNEANARLIAAAPEMCSLIARLIDEPEAPVWVRQKANAILKKINQ